MEDTKKELERLQKALLEQETLVGEDLTDDLPADLIADLDNAETAHLLEELAPQAEPSVDQTLQVDDAMLEELLAEVHSPAFDDPDAMPVSDETMVYCNFSNDYGKEPAEYAENGGEPTSADEARKQRDDKIVIGLMLTASVLCLGILGVLSYWLVKFL